MNKKMFLIILGCAFFLAAPGVHALTINSYTSLAAWQAAAPLPTLLQDFNSEATGSFTSRDFGDFTVSRTGTSITMAIAPGTEGNQIDGTNFLRMRSTNHTQSMLWNFDMPIFALGFDWRDTDDSGDDIELIVDSQSFEFGFDGQSGFFGIVATDGVFDSAMALSDTIGDGGHLTYGVFDNVRYSPVPEPTTMLLLGSGLIGLMAFRRNVRKL